MSTLLNKEWLAGIPKIYFYNIDIVLYINGGSKLQRPELACLYPATVCITKQS